MSKKKIVLVEDEEMTCKLIKRMLEPWGHKIIGIATTGEEAIDLMKNLSPDLIIMNIVLDGDLDGKTTTGGAYASFYCPSNISHGISNAGDTELKYLVIKKYLK